MNSFKPIHEDHGIEMAGIVMFLKNPLNNFEGISGKMVEGQSALRLVEDSILIKTSFDQNEIKQEERRVNGFVLKNERRDKLFHAYNEEFKTVFIYLDYQYDKWKPFFSTFKIVYEAFCSAIAPNKVTSIGLEYVDKFKWEGDKSNFKWNKLFRENSVLLSADFHQHDLLSFQIMREKKGGILEQLTINTDEDKSYATIGHHVSTEIDFEISENHNTFKSSYRTLEELHSFNKKLLVDLLTDEMALKVGLTK